MLSGARFALDIIQKQKNKGEPLNTGPIRGSQIHFIREVPVHIHLELVEYLAEMVQGEEQIERLLGEPAPEMDGR